MKKVYIIVLLLAKLFPANAQNNPIFSGGVSDGWDRNAFAQSSNNIFVGGEGDGWNFRAFAQNANNIFAGGEGDGWSFGSFLQAGNAIFVGGEGDGWNFKNFQQAGNNVFTGGGGDGWASVYRPLGVLPVTFLSFTAQKQGVEGLLLWQTAREEATASFAIERSRDAVQFEPLGSVPAAGFSATARQYSFTDKQPLAGPNYYRLKQIDRNGNTMYTPARLLIFNGGMLQVLKAYPVPATSLVTLELPINLLKEETVINVSNALGVLVQHIRLPRNRASNRQVLNLASLSAGVYTVQVSAPSFTGGQTIIKQ